MSSVAHLKDASETPVQTSPAIHRRAAVMEKLASVSTEVATTNPSLATVTMATHAQSPIHVKMAHAQVFLLPVMHHQHQSVHPPRAFAFTTVPAAARKAHAAMLQPL